MDRPRAPLLVTVSVSYLTNQAATANCVLAILFFAPFSESEQLGSHVRAMKLMSKPVSPVELTKHQHSRGTGPADQEYRGLVPAAPALLRSNDLMTKGAVSRTFARASSGRVIVSILTLLVVGRIALGDWGRGDLVVFIALLVVVCSGMPRPTSTHRTCRGCSCAASMRQRSSSCSPS